MADPQLRTTWRYGYFVPAASTALDPGDIVCVNAAGKLIAATKTGAGFTRFVGICEDKWSSVTAQLEFGDAAEYTTPSSTTLRRVLCQGVANLPISATTGKAGALVYLDSATQAAMTFTLTEPATASTVFPVGRIEQDFSGATSGDKQGVIIAPTFRGAFETDIDFYLNNHVIDGLQVAFDSTSLVSYKLGQVIVGGKYYKVAYASAALGVICASSTTKARMVLYYIGLGGTALLKDTKGVLFVRASAGTTTSARLRNSKFWPTFTYEGVVFGAGILYTASSDLKASHVKGVQRSLRDIQYRRFIVDNPIS